MDRSSSPTLRDDDTPIVPIKFDDTPPKLARGTGPVMTPRPARLIATPLAMPSMRELAELATNLRTAQTFIAGAKQLQRDLCKLLHVTDALCLWIDWPRRAVWNVTGQVGGQLCELVIDVAGTGKCETLGSTLLQPIGPRPARAVLALRRPSGSTFDVNELAMISTLAGGIAPALDRLMH